MDSQPVDQAPKKRKVRFRWISMILSFVVLYIIAMIANGGPVGLEYFVGVAFFSGILSLIVGPIMETMFSPKSDKD